MRRPLILLIAFAAFAVLVSSCSAQPDPETTIRAVERTLVGLPTEHAVVFDRASDFITQFDGGAGEVSLNGEFGGDIVTHNHPDEETLSTQDVEFAAYAHLYEIRVVMPSGNACAMTEWLRPFEPMGAIPDDEWLPALPGKWGRQPNWYAYAAANGLLYRCFHL